MKKPAVIGPVVASRQLTARRSDGTERAVVVEIGAPVHLEADGPWWCPFRIQGLGDGSVQSIAGEDSLQALVLSFRYLAGMLPYDAERQGETIAWLDGDDLGIPM